MRTADEPEESGAVGTGAVADDGPGAGATSEPVPVAPVAAPPVGEVVEVAIADPAGRDDSVATGSLCGRDAASHQPVAATTATSVRPSAAAPRRPGSQRTRIRRSRSDPTEGRPSGTCSSNSSPGRQPGSGSARMRAAGSSPSSSRTRSATLARSPRPGRPAARTCRTLGSPLPVHGARPPDCGRNRALWTARPQRSHPCASGGRRLRAPRTQE